MNNFSAFRIDLLAENSMLKASYQVALSSFQICEFLYRESLQPVASVDDMDFVM